MSVLVNLCLVAGEFLKGQFFEKKTYDDQIHTYAYLIRVKIHLFFWENP